MILSDPFINVSLLTDFCQVYVINIDICGEILKVVKKNTVTLLNIMFKGQKCEIKCEPYESICDY